MLNLLIGLVLLVAAIAYGWIYAYRMPLQSYRSSGTHRIVSRKRNVLDWLLVFILAALALHFLRSGHYHTIHLTFWWGIVGLALLVLALLVAALRGLIGALAATALALALICAGLFGVIAHETKGHHYAKQATLSAVITTHKVGLDVTFDATKSFDHNKNRKIGSYSWDFGNGIGSNQPVIGYTYDKGDTYTVTLTVKEAKTGKTATATKKIKVAAPAAPATASPSSSPSASSTATNAGLIAAAAQATAQQDLIVDYTQVSTDMCVKLVQKYFGTTGVTSVPVGTTSVQTPTFVVGAMHSVVGSAKLSKGEVQRLWSDGTNIPAAAKLRTLEGQQATVCHDPAQAAMVMNGLGRGSIGGITVAHQNSSWIQAQGDPKAAISSWAQQCWTTNVAVHLACAKTMAAAATLLGRFHSQSVLRATSKWNIHLAHGGLVVGKVPAFALNSVQEHNSYFLVISVTAKTGGCFLRYGFNMGRTVLSGGDQRLAGLACVPPTPTSGCTSKCGGGNGCTSNCTPGCTSKCGSSTPACAHPFPNGVCPQGKHASDAPSPSGGPVMRCPGGYLGRDGNCHSGHYTPPASPSGPPSHSGTGPRVPPPTDTPAPPSDTSTHSGDPSSSGVPGP